MFLLGIIIGAIIGFGFAALLVANQEEDYTTYTKSIRSIVSNEFALRLKEKVLKPESPWEEVFICESDIDEVLNEMVGDTE